MELDTGFLIPVKQKKKIVELSKIKTRINRAGLGNFGDHRFLCGNLGELRVDYGPGYRIYFALDEDIFLVLLNGGTKSKQQQDIELASTRWQWYQKEKDKEAGHGK